MSPSIWKSCSLGLLYTVFVWVPECQFGFWRGAFFFIVTFPDRSFHLPFDNSELVASTPEHVKWDDKFPDETCF